AKRHRSPAALSSAPFVRFAVPFACIAKALGKTASFPCGSLLREQQNGPLRVVNNDSGPFLEPVRYFIF
ncbi:hypothetical protein LK494_08290, partial [Anaerovorax odorimutans]|nr:hypothetical protein [Anaerovorax odorimutans]